MPSSAEVRAFYDQFLREHMLRYRLYGNRRIERAVQRAADYVRGTSLVLEVACGIGIVAEQLARQASKGRVWGIDISPRNIWYASQTVRKPNVTFIASDVASDFTTVKAAIPAPVDVLVLIDVIEHISDGARAALFARRREMSAERAYLILTFCSPACIRELEDRAAQLLQIVDNAIEPEVLIHASRMIGVADAAAAAPNDSKSCA